MQPLTMKKVISLMDEKYYLVYTDYRDTLNEHLKTIELSIAQKSADPIYELLNDAYWECRADGADREFAELKEKCISAGYDEDEVHDFFEGHEDEIKDHIYDRDESDYVADIIDRTSPLPVLITMYSNYDCINSHWFEAQGGFRYEEHYLGDMIDALYLNPAKVKQLLVNQGYTVSGRWPNRNYREGKELVSYVDFMVEMENSCTPVNLLVFKARLSLRQLYDADFNIAKVTIPAGNCCGLYSHCHGGGSLIGIKLLKDVTLKLDEEGYDYYSLSLDKYNDEYSIIRVYGEYDSFFGDELKIAA